MSTTENLSTTGKSRGKGTFAEATITKCENTYHLAGSSKQGIRFRCYIKRIYVNYNEEIDMDGEEKRDISGKEFKLGDETLHLR